MASPGKSTSKQHAVKKAPKLHPSFLEMAIEAIRASSDTKGASVPSIRNYITENYKSVDPTTVRYRLKQALMKALEKNMINKSKQSDDRPLMSSRFRILATKKKKVTKSEDKENKIAKQKKEVKNLNSVKKPRALKKASNTMKSPAKSPKKSPAKLARKNTVKVPKPKVFSLYKQVHAYG